LRRERKRREKKDGKSKKKGRRNSNGSFNSNQEDEDEEEEEVSNDSDNEASSEYYSSESDDEYFPGFLDDPEMVQGRHRHVMVGDMVTGPIVTTTILFVKPKALKADLNKLFRERFDDYDPPLSQRKFIGAKVVNGVYTLAEDGKRSVNNNADALNRQRSANQGGPHQAATATAAAEAAEEAEAEASYKMSSSLTLSKIRSIKLQTLMGCVKAGCEISTVALACVYFERLCLDCYVDKSNRRLTMAACLLLAYKTNEHMGGVDKAAVLSKLLTFTGRDWNLQLETVFAAEWGVFVALGFKLHATPLQINFHFLRLMKVLELQPVDYLCEVQYNNWQESLRVDAIRREKKAQWKEAAREKKEREIIRELKRAAERERQQQREREERESEERKGRLEDEELSQEESERGEQIEEKRGGEQQSGEEEVDEEEEDEDADADDEDDDEEEDDEGEDSSSKEEENPKNSNSSPRSHSPINLLSRLLRQPSSERLLNKDSSNAPRVQQELPLKISAPLTGKKKKKKKISSSSNNNNSNISSSKGKSKAAIRGPITECFSWEALTEIVSSNTLHLLGRSVEDEVKYAAYNVGMKKEWLRPFEFVLHTKFDYEKVLYEEESEHEDEDESDEEARSLRKRKVKERSKQQQKQKQKLFTVRPQLSEIKKAQITLVKNDFPYYLEEGIFHYILWKIAPASSSSTTITETEMEDAYEELRAIYSLESEEGHQNEDGEEEGISFLNWVNPLSIKSLPEIEHAHILVKTNY
jgi:hypothetical protein